MLATAYVPRLPEQPTYRLEPSQQPAIDPLNEYMSRGALRTIGSKEHLFCAGDRATHVYRIEFGHVCIYRMMPDGRRQVVDFAYPGDIVGLGAMSEHGESAQAIEQTVVRIVAVASLRGVAASDSRLARRLYEVLANELIAARELLFTVSQRTAAERVAGFLLALANRGKRCGDAAGEIVLPMSRNDIADFLGLTIETVSRTLTRFRLDGIISLEHCILVSILAPDVLAAIAEGQQLTKILKLESAAPELRHGTRPGELVRAG